MNRSIRPYLAFSRQALREELVWKERVIMVLFFVGTRMASQLYFWLVVYRHSTVIKGFQLQDIISYIFISTTLGFLFSGLLERKLADSIADGSIAMDLIKPVQLYYTYFFSYLGKVAFQAITYVPIISIVGVLFFGLHGPHSAQMWLLFFLTLVLDFLLWHSIRWLFSLLVFWTGTGDGIARVGNYIVTFLSGSLLPLSFYPSGIVQFFYYLPFQSVIYTPTAIFTDTITPLTASKLLGLEVCWVVVLFFVSRWLWERAVRALTVQGG